MMAMQDESRLSIDQQVVLLAIRKLHSVGLKATYKTILPHTRWGTEVTIAARCRELADQGFIARGSRGSFEPVADDESGERPTHNPHVAGTDPAQPQGGRDAAA